MEQVQVTDRHHAESLSLFQLRPGDLVVTDAGYQVGSSVDMTQQQQAVLLQRTTASHLHLEDEQGQTISLKERVKHLAGNSLKEVEGCVRLPSSSERGCGWCATACPQSKPRKPASAKRPHCARSTGAITTTSWCGGPTSNCWSRRPSERNGAGKTWWHCIERDGTV
jgi:hypothetical protein